MTQPEIGGTAKGRAVMIFGSDGSKWIAGRIDGLGHFQVDVVASGLPDGAAEETTLAAIKTALEILMYFAHPNNVIFGYYDRLLEADSGEGEDGALTLASGTPDTDEIWVVTNISIWHTDAVARRCRLQVIEDSNEYEIASIAALDRRETLDRQTNLILKNGDSIKGIVLALASGGDGFLAINGYKCKVS